MSLAGSFECLGDQAIGFSKNETPKSGPGDQGQNGAFVAEFVTRRPSSIRELPRYRVVLRGFRVFAGGDRTGWLGRQDSNLGMAESKSAISFRQAPSQTDITPDASGFH
jgi:hypothetical protein